MLESAVGYLPVAYPLPLVAPGQCSTGAFAKPLHRGLVKRKIDHKCLSSLFRVIVGR